MFGRLVLQRRVNCSPRGPRCRMRPPAGRCTLLNKNCSSCSLAHSAPAAAALAAAGLLCLRLGPRLLPTGFAGVQQDQTPDAVPGRQSVECGRERGLDQRQADQLDQRRPFRLPLLLHGHGQRVVQAKVDKLCKRRLFGKLQICRNQTWYLSILCSSHELRLLARSIQPVFGTNMGTPHWGVSIKN